MHSAFSIRFGRSIAFILGASFSAITGYVGMWLAVRANVRTANAARESGLRQAVKLAFRAGGVAGMFTVGLGLFGATAILIIYKQDATSVLVGFGFGGALLAMFMRVGGGIFTKAADVGADLVGKIEQGIPEDDPRNAATIADNVGDNVGDCAGMAADLFESAEVTLIASLILGAAAYADSPKGAIIGVMFPLFIRAVGVVTSMIGIMAVTPRTETESGMKAINRGFFISAFISAAAAFVIANLYMDSYKPAIAVSIGLVLAAVIQVLTQYFTDTKFKPVQEIAESTVTGPATTILSGFSTGLESTVYSALILAGAIVASYYLGGTTAERLYFISLTGMGMLTTVGVVVSMDTYGPISDNAQGIAEMSGEFEGRPAEILGGLDAVGNSTKAITKGMAIATAVLAATSLFGSFEEALRLAGFDFLGIRVDRPDVLVGLLIGGSVPFLFSSLAVRAVGRAAAQVVVEVRNQFRLHPGIMTYEEKPDYGAVVDICTKTSLRELTTPGLLAILSPIFAGFFLKGEALGGFLAGAILTGPAAGRDAVQRGRRVGQRQEVHRGGQLRRQGIGESQGRGHRRHGRRPVQGHGRPRAQPTDQGHEPGGPADRTARGDPRRRHRPAHHHRDRDRRGPGRRDLHLQVSQVRARRGDQAGQREDVGLASRTSPTWAGCGATSRRLRTVTRSACRPPRSNGRRRCPVRSGSPTLHARQRVRLAGMVRRISVLPIEGIRSLEATITDGTGEVNVVFMGRRNIEGMSLGTRVVVEGVIGDQRDVRRIVNPKFEFSS